MTQDTEDGESRYLSRDEAEARLCEIILDIELTEKHWRELRAIDPVLPRVATVFHPRLSAEFWDDLAPLGRRAAVAGEEFRTTMVRNVVHSIMPNYVEED